MVIFVAELPSFEGDGKFAISTVAFGIVIPCAGTIGAAILIGTMRN